MSVPPLPPVVAALVHLYPDVLFTLPDEHDEPWARLLRLSRIHLNATMVVDVDLLAPKERIEKVIHHLCASVAGSGQPWMARGWRYAVPLAPAPPEAQGREGRTDADRASDLGDLLLRRFDGLLAAIDPDHRPRPGWPRPVLESLCGAIGSLIVDYGYDRHDRR